MHTKEKSQLYYHNDNSVMNDLLSSVIKALILSIKKIYK